jgi:hypothetical protein
MDCGGLALAEEHVHGVIASLLAPCAESSRSYERRGHQLKARAPPSETFPAISTLPDRCGPFAPTTAPTLPRPKGRGVLLGQIDASGRQTAKRMS